MKHRILEPNLQNFLNVVPPPQDAALSKDLDLQVPRRIGTETHSDRAALLNDSVVCLLCELAVSLPDGVAEIVLDVNPANDVADHEVRPAEAGE